MQLASWNVNSLRSNEDKFLKFVDDYQPDILLLQEVRASSEQLSMFLQNINGYTFLNNYSGRPGYGGTAVYYKNNLAFSSITFPGLEGRTIVLEKGNLIILNLYVPNGNSHQYRLDYKKQFYNDVAKHVESLINQGKEIIIGGDLNIAHTDLDLFSPKTNRRHSGFLDWERQWLTDLLESGMIDTFRIFNQSGGNYTWWHMRDPTRQNNKGWRYDYFLISSNLKNKVVKSEILKNVFGSDHCPIILEL